LVLVEVLVLIMVRLVQEAILCFQVLHLQVVVLVQLLPT
jgi:hypothetical protein